MWGAVSFGGMSRLGVDYVSANDLGKELVIPTMIISAPADRAKAPDNQGTDKIFLYQLSSDKVLTT